jgi:hypothetical protein
MKSAMDRLEALLARSTHRPETGCRTLPPMTKKKGYAVVSIGNKPTLAHRFCFTVVHGPIPEGKIVMHTCDVRNCIEPSHLRAGTVLENNRDRDEKERQPRGETHGMHVLTEDDVREIRTRITSGESVARTAARFGISGPHAYNIANRKKWRHVTDDARHTR